MLQGLTDLQPYSSRVERGGSYSLIHKLGRLAPLTPDDRVALNDMVGSADWIAQGRFVAREGDRGETLHIVLHGWVCRHRDFRDGRRQIIAVLLSGDLCGDHERLDLPLDDGYLALTRARVARVPKSIFRRTLSEHPAIAHGFARASLIDRAILRTWLVSFGQRQGYERTAHFFCELAHRASEHNLDVSDGVFGLPLTQQELGCALGMTSVHVHRVLQRLRAERLIDLHGGVLSILDLERLGAIAGFDPAYLGL